MPGRNEPKIDSTPVRNDDAAGEITPMSVDKPIFEGADMTFKSSTNDLEIVSTNAAGKGKDSAQQQRVFAS